MLAMHVLTCVSVRCRCWRVDLDPAASRSHHTRTAGAGLETLAALLPSRLLLCVAIVAGRFRPDSSPVFLRCHGAPVLLLLLLLPLIAPPSALPWPSSRIIHHCACATPPAPPLQRRADVLQDAAGVRGARRPAQGRARDPAPLRRAAGRAPGAHTLAGQRRRRRQGEPDTAGAWEGGREAAAACSSVMQR